MGESYLNRIIQHDPSAPNEGYVRPSGVPNGEEIISNAPIIENGGVNYYPIYYICNMDSLVSESFTKTGTGVSTGADAFVFSDEPSTLYVGDTIHTFNTANDYATSENWKCRYIIAYATEDNKNAANGITVNLYNYKAIFEFIGSQYLKLSNTSALSGQSGSETSTDINLRYVNLINSSFYNDEISISYFCSYCVGMISISLPSVTIISGAGFCQYCYSLKSLYIPNLATISGGSFCKSCYSLESLYIPNLATISGALFCNSCYSLKSLSLPSVTTTSGSDFCTSCSSLESLYIPNLATISGALFCNSCYSLKSLSLPSVTTTSGNNFCIGCYSLESLSMPNLTTISGTGFCSSCSSLKSLSLPLLTTISATNFCYSCYRIKSLDIPSITSITGGFCYKCHGMEYYNFPSTITSVTQSDASMLSSTQFIGLPNNFNIDAVNFTGATGYSKSIVWFTHLATQLKDNSGGTVHTMVLGSANIAMIPSAQATIISNKNWTLS